MFSICCAKISKVGAKPLLPINPPHCIWCKTSVSCTSSFHGNIRICCNFFWFKPSFPCLSPNHNSPVRGENISILVLECFMHKYFLSIIFCAELFLFGAKPHTELGVKKSEFGEREKIRFGAKSLFLV